MANELSISYTGTKSVYGIVRRTSDGYAFSSPASGYVAWTNLDVGNYAITMNDSGGHLWLANAPTGYLTTNSEYRFEYYEQSGPSPVYINDLFISADEGMWDGTHLDTGEIAISAPLVTMVRVLTNDFSNTPSKQAFGDERIAITLAVAGVIVSREYEFLGYQAGDYYATNSYNFDINKGVITPDPTNIGNSGQFDPIAVALFTLKAACILDTNRMQGAVGRGAKIKEGDSQIDTTEAFKGYKDILIYGPCSSYAKLLKQARQDATSMVGKAVVSPPTHPSYILSSNNTMYDVRRFFDQFVYRI